MPPGVSVTLLFPEAFKCGAVTAQEPSLSKETFMSTAVLRTRELSPPPFAPWGGSFSVSPTATEVLLSY